MVQNYLLSLCCWLSYPAQGPQTPLPDAPSATRAWALNLGTNAKYSVTEGKWDSVPKVVLDYRFLPAFRTGLEYSHSIETGDNSLSVVLNYKLAEWGRKR